MNHMTTIPLEALHELTAKYYTSAYGSTDFAAMPGEINVPTPDAEHDVRYVAFEDSPGQLVASVTTWAPRNEAGGRASCQIVIDPDRADQGLADEAVAAAEAMARQLGRTHLGVWTAAKDFRPVGSYAMVPEIEAPRPGFDELWSMRGGPLQEALRKRGYNVGMNAWRGTLTSDVPMPERAAIPEGFEVTAVHGGAHGGVPEELVDGIAQLREQAWNDIPMGTGPKIDQHWDAARWRGFEQAMAADGMDWILLAVRNPSGRLVGYTILHWMTARPEAVYQGVTVVAPEGRGHGIGQILKTHGLAFLPQANPTWKTIFTWNEVNNAPILAVNARAGYRQTAMVARWDRDLSEHGC